jgi:hypothetical protein
MGSLLRRSLYLALLWRAVIGVAAVVGAMLLVPDWWMGVIAGVVVAVWFSWSAGRFVTNGIEAIEPAAASVGVQTEETPEPAFRQLEGIVDGEAQTCG